MIARSLTVPATEPPVIWVRINTRIVKTPEGWKFKKRTFFPEARPPSTQH